MTKKELLEMIKDIDENEEVVAVLCEYDRDGIYEEYKTNKFVGIIKKDAEPIKKIMGNNIYI